MTGRPVSMTLRTMLSLMRDRRRGVGDRLALDVAGRADALPVEVTGSEAGSPPVVSPGLSPVKASSFEQDEPLLGAGDLDDRVEHRLEQLVDVLQRSSASR